MKNEYIKNWFWTTRIIPENIKESLFFLARRLKYKEYGKINRSKRGAIFEQYRRQILNIPQSINAKFYKSLAKDDYKRCDGDAKIIAYYLPQMYPTKENNKWWGLGTTEWNNVSKSMPVYLNQYQPRLPGELGYYDLRIKDNIKRQIELAKKYAIYGFCFYYYWFDGKRLLDKPLDMFIEMKNDFPFCLCWANENWKKSFTSGGSNEALVVQSTTEESYMNFIRDFIKYLRVDNYITIEGKKVVVIYRPHSIPNPKKVLNYWREYCRENGVGELYIIGCWFSNTKDDLIDLGFDAMSEFQPGSILNHCEKINDKIEFVCETYDGAIYSYSDLVEDEIYKKNYDKEKMYHAIMPMWDNTARRGNKGGLVFDGSTPIYYKKWLKEIILDTKNKNDLLGDFIFLNSWNEWGEGSYIEPDRSFGYAYLQATRDAVEDARKYEV